MGEREAVLAQAKQQMAEQAKWEAQQQAQLEKWDADLTCRQAALRERGDALNQQQARLQAERNVLEQQQAQQQTQLEKWVADLACREAELNARDQQQARLQAQLDQRETQLTDGVMSVAKQKVALESPRTKRERDCLQRSLSRAERHDRDALQRGLRRHPAHLGAAARPFRQGCRGVQVREIDSNAAPRTHSERAFELLLMFKVDRSLLSNNSPLLRQLPARTPVPQAERSATLGRCGQQGRGRQVPRDGCTGRQAPAHSHPGGQEPSGRK